MGTSKPVAIDKKEEERSKNYWARFTTFMKWSIIFVVITLAFMAAVFIR